MATKCRYESSQNTDGATGVNIKAGVDVYEVTLKQN